MKKKTHRFVGNKYLVSFGMGMILTAFIRLLYADSQYHVIGLLIAGVIGAVCIIIGGV